MCSNRRAECAHLRSAGFVFSYHGRDAIKSTRLHVAHLSSRMKPSLVTLEVQANVRILVGDFVEHEFIFTRVTAKSHNILVLRFGELERRCAGMLIVTLLQ